MPESDQTVARRDAQIDDGTMSKLEALGVAVQRKLHSKLLAADIVGSILLTDRYNHYQTTPNTLTTLTLTLPRPVAVRARFSHEKIANKLIKLFRHELQTGDQDFDRAVYVTTDTLDATKVLLESDDVRRAVALTVTTGGPIEVAETIVTMTVFGEQDGDDANAITLVHALLG